ncbi:MAG: phosphatidate cytidylyltransferase [Fibrobacterota bacterium]
MSNLVKRILFAIFGIPAVLYIISLGGLYLLAFTAVVAVAGMVEFLGLFGWEKTSFVTLSSSFISLLIIYTGLMHSDFIPVLISEITILSLFVIFIVIQIKNNAVKEPLLGVNEIFFGFFYVSFLMRYVFILGGPLNETESLVENRLLMTFCIVWAGDISAYFTGKYFGKTKILPEVSPKKTIVGSTGQVAGALITALLFAAFVPSIGFFQAAAAGLGCGILGQVGDFWESLLKRYSGKKDSSGLLPGHGGVLDRFDSMLLCAPYVYIVFAVSEKAL